MNIKLVILISRCCIFLKYYFWFKEHAGREFCLMGERSLGSFGWSIFFELSLNRFSQLSITIFLQACGRALESVNFVEAQSLVLFLK